MSESHPRLIEYLLILITATVCTLFFALMQPQILISGGLGWDGIDYAKLFGYFSKGDYHQAQFPFCNRLGAPYLASLTGITQAQDAFQFINTPFSILFSCIIYIICRNSGFNKYHSLLAFSLTIIPFFSPARFIPFYPVYTDPSFLALLSLAYLLLLKEQYLWSFFLIVATHIFREVGIYLLILFYIFSIYMKGFDRQNFIYFISGLIALMSIKYFIQHNFNCNGSQISAAVSRAFSMLTNPELLVRYFAAIAMTAAPALFLHNINNLSSAEKISVVGLIFSAVLAFLGGSDSTRIFYSFFPIYVIAIISSIRSNGYLFSLFCIIGYVTTNRFGQKMQEPLHQWPDRDTAGFFYQFPDHALPEVSVNILVIWAIIFLAYKKSLPHRNDRFSDLHSQLLKSSSMRIKKTKD